MVSFFREKSAVAIFAGVIITIALRSHFLVTPPVVLTQPADGLLYYIISPLSTLPSIALSAIFHIIIILQALRLNYILNDLRLFQRQAYTTFFAYITLTAVIPEWNNISTALVANSMVIWLLYKMAKLYTAPQPKTYLFNLGLLTGITVILYFPAVAMIAAVFIALGILRPFKINEWFVLLMGMITPFYFWASYLFITNKLLYQLNSIQIFTIQVIRPVHLIQTIATLSYCGILLIIGLYWWQQNSQRMVIQVRKTWAVVFFLFFCLLPLVFFIKNSWPNVLLLAAVPAASYLSNVFFYPKKTLFPALLWWLMVALIVYNNWYVIKF